MRRHVKWIRRLICGGLALLCSTMMLRAATPGQRTEELMGIANAIFKDFNADLTDDARTELFNVVSKGAKNIDTEEQMHQARIAIARIAQAMIDCSPQSPCPTTRNRIVLNLLDLQRALKKLCPLYPFC